MDIVSKEIRSRMMSCIKGKNTKPERLIRSALHKQGYRFRLHNKNLPSNPDIVLNKHKAVIFVHGCFWHGHNCHLFRLPQTRTQFWQDKIQGNKYRDLKSIGLILKVNWRVCVIWECAIKNNKNIIEICDNLSRWILSDSQYFEIQGKK